MDEVIWPRGKRSGGVVRFAKRLETLKGKTICELWDGVFKGDAIYAMMEKELPKRYPGSKFVIYKVFGSTHGRGERETLAALSDKLRLNNCDAVISGVGC